VVNYPNYNATDLSDWEYQEEQQNQIQCKYIAATQQCYVEAGIQSNTDNDQVTILTDLMVGSSLGTKDYINESFWQSDQCPVTKAYLDQGKEVEGGEEFYAQFLNKKAESCFDLLLKYLACIYIATGKHNKLMQDGTTDGRADFEARKLCNLLDEMNQCGNILSSGLLTSKEVSVLRNFKLKNVASHLTEDSNWVKYMNWDSTKCPVMQTIYYQVKFDEKCKRRKNSLVSTNLTSPNYPHAYPANVSKEYTFAVSEGKKVMAEFLVLDLEDECNEECVFDWVKVIDGHLGDILLNKTCASNKPEPFTSKSNKIKIIFHTDASLEKQGWLLNVKEV